MSEASLWNDLDSDVLAYVKSYPDQPSGVTALTNHLLAILDDNGEIKYRVLLEQPNGQAFWNLHIQGLVQQFKNQKEMSITLDLSTNQSIEQLARLVSENLNCPESELLLYHNQKAAFYKEYERAKEIARRYDLFNYEARIPNFEDWQKTVNSYDTPDEKKQQYERLLPSFKATARIAARIDMLTDLVIALKKERVPYPIAEKVVFEQANDVYFASRIIEDATTKLYPKWREESRKVIIFQRTLDYVNAKLEGLKPQLKECVKYGYSLSRIAKNFSTFPTVKESVIPEFLLYEVLRLYGKNLKEVVAEANANKQHEHLPLKCRVKIMGFGESLKQQQQRLRFESRVKYSLFSDSDEQLLEFFLNREGEFGDFLKDKRDPMQDVTQAKATELDVFQRKVQKLGYNPSTVTNYDELIKVLDAKGYSFNEIVDLLGITIKDPYMALWRDKVAQVTGKRDPDLTFTQPKPVRVINTKDVKPLPSQNIDKALRVDQQDQAQIEPHLPEQTSIPQLKPLIAQVINVNDVKTLSQDNFNTPQDSSTALTHMQTVKPETQQPQQTPTPETDKAVNDVQPLTQKSFNQPLKTEQTQQTDEVPDKDVEPQGLGRVPTKVEPTIKDASNIDPLTQTAFNKALKNQDVSNQQTDKEGESKT